MMEWLVISYYARMPGACQAEWIDDRIHALKDLGENVSLISSMCSGIYPGITNLRACSLLPADLDYEFREIVRRRDDHSLQMIKFSQMMAYLLKPLVWIESKILNVHGEGRWSWIPIALLCSLLELARKRHDVIFSTGGPASAHIVAIIAGKMLGKTVVCELQDPLVGPDIGRNRFSRLGLQLAEKFILKNADRVIFCTKNASEDAARRLPALRSKVTHIYPGSWSRANIEKRPFGAKIRFCYLGSLYQTRNLDRFMESLLLLKAKGIDIENRLELNIYGNMNPDIRKRIEKFPYPVIKLKSMVSREKALALAQESDVLLLIQNTDERSHLTIPFKTYDYLQSGNLILGLIYKNDELRSLLEKSGHKSCPADDVSGIQKTLEEILDTTYANTSIPTLTPIEAARSMVTMVAPSNAKCPA
jgi:glycosyltransferase involved in cell wall biosynthesis